MTKKLEKRKKTAVAKLPDGREVKLTSTLEQIAATMGTKSNMIAIHFTSQLGEILRGGKDLDEIIAGECIDLSIKLMAAVQPADETEAMLILQMIGLHELAMVTMIRASREDRTEVMNLKLNQVTRLSRAFANHLEVLNKHRGKGQQKMTVEHVHVNKGGQAVIGNVEKGGG